MYLELCSLLPTKYYSLSLINACMYHALSIMSNISNHAVIRLIVTVTILSYVYVC